MKFVKSNFVCDAQGAPSGGATAEAATAAAAAPDVGDVGCRRRRRARDVFIRDSRIARRCGGRAGDALYSVLRDRRPRVHRTRAHPVRFLACFEK